MTISINKVLIDATSAAIWNRSKIAVAMAIGVWAINIIFIIQGMFLLLPFTAGHMGSHNCCFFQQVLCMCVTDCPTYLTPSSYSVFSFCFHP